MAGGAEPAYAFLVDEGSLAPPAFAILCVASEGLSLSFSPFVHDCLRHSRSTYFGSHVRSVGEFIFYLGDFDQSSLFHAVEVYGVAHAVFGSVA